MGFENCLVKPPAAAFAMTLTPLVVIALQI